MRRSPLSIRPWLLALGLILFLPALTGAANGDSAKAYRHGYNLVLDEDWSGAIAAFDKLIESYPASDWVDDAEFWRCYARQQLGEPSAALFECYEDLLASYPRSDWADDARRSMVRLAQQLARDGRTEYRSKVRGFGQDEDGDRLLAILVALGEIGDERSVQVILERLEGTEDEQLRARIVEALDDVESRAALEKLQEILKSDPSERVRLAALETLADHSSFDSTALLRAIIQDPEQPIRLRIEAVDELADDERPGLLHFLKEVALGESDELAMEAIEEIGNFESEAALRMLVEILGQTPVYERRVEILDSLEDIELEAAVEALFEIARRDPDPRMRRAATEALGDMEISAAREALIELLKEIDSGTP